MRGKQRIIPIFVPHLGCPNDCVFCNQRRISGTAIPATAQTVFAALCNIEPGEGYELAFYGGSFTAISVREQEMLLKAAEPFLQSGVITAIRVSTRPDAIDIESLERLWRFGVRTIEIGAQSMCDDVLELSGRGHTAKCVETASALIKKAGFSLILQMMTGLPGDTEEGAIETARRLIALAPHGVRIYPTVVIDATKLYDMWKEGTYTAHTVEEAVSICARIVPMFTEAGISVIRLGLNPTDDLSAGEAIAGAYHPALGELVYARILRQEAERLLQGIAPNSAVTMGVHQSKLSQMIGQKRENITFFMQEYDLRDVRIVPLETMANDVCLMTTEQYEIEGFPCI